MIERTVRFRGEHADVVLRDAAERPLANVLASRKKSVTVGCLNRSCGACRILLNGRLVKSCEIPFADLVDGAELATADEVANNTAVTNVLFAFREARQTRCELCVTGLAVTAEYATIHPELAPEDLVHGMTCRCTGTGSLKRALAVLRDPTT